MSYIYLASPYTDAAPAIMEQRYRLAEAATAYLLQKEIAVYSPITHCHTMAVRYNLPRDIEFWRKYNFSMLHPARELWVLDIPGWEKSKGIQEEVDFAKQNSIPYILFPLPTNFYVAAT